MELFTNLTPEEKLIKARIRLNKRSPFFAYLVMKLHFQEDKEIETIAVDMYGNCIYNPEWINGLDNDDSMYVLAHEVLHCALEHLIRLKSRDMRMWNISTDAVNNAILNTDGFVYTRFSKDGINPDNLFDKTGKKIENICSKTAEEIYDLIFDGKNTKDREQGFDKHIFDDKYNKGNINNVLSKSMSDGRYWKKQLSDAYAYGKMKGNVPAGVERQLEKLLDNTIDWKGKLYKHITNLVPIDYTWRTPHKKSYSLKTYLPNVYKEKLDVIVDLDTSGSISQKQLTEFLSEVVGILHQFNNVNLTLLSNDTKVYNPKTYMNPTINDVAKYKPNGGGGTDHRPVFEWVRKNMPTAQVLICFTDGMTTFPQPCEVNINTIWVISKGNKDSIPFGDVIELRRND